MRLKFDLSVFSFSYSTLLVAYVDCCLRYPRSMYTGTATVLMRPLAPTVAR